MLTQFFIKEIMFYFYNWIYLQKGHCNTTSWYDNFHDVFVNKKKVEILPLTLFEHNFFLLIKSSLDLRTRSLCKK